MKTVLCVPGHDEKKVKNCRKYGADLILFDLEDSVPEDKKERARETVREHATAADAVRINSIDGPSVYGPRDLALVDSLDALAGVWLPKAQDWMWGWSFKHPIVYIVETPSLLSRLVELTSRDQNPAPFYLTGLAFGAADFAAYMNVPASSPQVAYARQQVALAAKALGVEAYDSPCTTMHVSQVCAETREARMLGYGWKGVVHPEQVAPVKHADDFNGFWDRKLVDLYEAQSEAVMMFEGDVIAPPMIRAAKKRLEEQGEEQSK